MSGCVEAFLGSSTDIEWTKETEMLRTRRQTFKDIANCESLRKMKNSFQVKQTKAKTLT